MHFDGFDLKTQGSFLSESLLDWYDDNHRILPWRANPGTATHPYGVLVSEFMLQQTTVQTVLSYFPAFLAKWPTLLDLAKADRDDVLHARQGLGYYRRAHGLHNCVIAIAEQFNGTIPQDKKTLPNPPGIGDYTAAAILSIAFNKPHLAIDGNVGRVLSRYLDISLLPAPLSKKLLTLERELLPTTRFGDFTQAIMDLGSSVCMPKNPQCHRCPLQSHCLARKNGTVNALPLKIKKISIPTRQVTFFWIENAKGEILLEKRPHGGLFGGMTVVPSTLFDTKELEARDGGEGPAILHTFTHFKLIGQIARNPNPTPSIEGEVSWYNPEQFKTLALPMLMKKVIRSGLAGF